MAYIGSSVKRREDVPLLRGVGKYVGDIRRPGMVHAAILRSPAMERVRAARRVWRELPLAWYDAGQDRYVEGFVDLAFEEADGWILADYKTDAVPAAAQGGIGLLLERYRPQVDEYRRAAAATGMQVAACGLWLATDGTLHLL